jgi:tetratricopeptide (TPR) repeat protein
MKSWLRATPLFLLLVVWLLSAIGRAAYASNLKGAYLDEEDIKQLVVMVDAKLGEDSLYGTGIIFGAGADSLYIATANHVVRVGEVEAEDIQVRFRWRPDQPVQASLMRQRDSKLDLAVVRVVGLKVIGARLDALPFERVRNPMSLQRGEGLYLLGYPLRKAWRMNTTPEKFAEVTADSVDFESNFVARGHSGGALLDEQHSLVGMLKSDTPPYGEAVSITKIAYRLREWGYSVRLGIPTIPVTFSSLSAASSHVCGLTATGAAYCWGSIGSDDTRGDRFGDHGSTTFSALPVRVRGGLIFHSISAGEYHTCGVTTNGHAYCWGSNGDGELGSNQGGQRDDGEDESSDVPVPVAGGITFRMVSAGELRTCGVSIESSAYCWGFEGLGPEPTYHPMPVAGSIKFESVGNGNLTLGVSNSGETYWWGDVAKSDIPVRAPGNIRLGSLGKSCGLTNSGDAYCWGPPIDSKNAGVAALRVPGGLTFQTLSDNDSAACAVTMTGEVYCWRFPGPYFGQDVKSAEFVAKHIPGEIRFTSVATGGNYACSIAKAGGIYCWGKLPNIYKNPEEGEDYGPAPVPVSRVANWECFQTIEDARLEGDFKSAWAQAEAALRSYPNDRGIRRVHAIVLTDLGRPADAIIELRSLLNGDKDRRAYIDLARTYKRAKNFDEMARALGYAEKLSHSEAEKGEVYFELAAAYEIMQQHEKAEEEYRKILKQDPENTRALNNLGYMLAERNVRLAEAEELIRRALKMYPQNGDYMDSLGLVYERMGKLDEAEADLQQAWKSVAAAPDVPEHLGDVYFRRGKIEEAIARWQEALQQWERCAPIDVDPAQVKRVKKKLDNARNEMAK